MARQSYSHKPLDTSQNEIRLIKLQAPIKSQPLCGTIVHIPLSAKSQYCALSYCWGSLAGKRTIILDGKDLQITVNLDNALRQLGNSYGMLWVDAISINQADIPERSKQVLRMGEIYSLASAVVAWLGVADKTSDRGMDFLQVLATREPRAQYEEYLKELPSRDSPGKFRHDWTCLKDLVRREYWSRTWIVQELALCKSSRIVHCGTKSLPWDNFKRIFCPDVHNDFSKANDCIVEVVFDTKELAEVRAGMDNLRVLSILQNPELRQALSFQQLSHLTSSFLATDPRDRIYGMLGLVSEELRCLVPHPDYAKTKDAVFRDLTIELLKGGYNLDLICIKNPTHVNQSDAVSWVPDWAVYGLWTLSPEWLVQATKGNHTRGIYSADAGKPAILSYESPTLRVRGLSYDRVDGLGPTETGHGVKEGRKKYNAVQPNHRQNADGSDVDTFRALKQLSVEIFRTLGFGGNGEFLIPRVYRQRAKFMDHPSYELAREWLHETEEFIFLGRSLRQWFEMAYTHGQTLPSSSSAVQKDPELVAIVGYIKQLKVEAWRWLSTDRGYLGRTHPQAQKGDEIVIIQGCTVPVVLRPCGRCYSVVGAAYVQGIMNGEALRGLRDDQMQYFDLV
jgi:hypothetical protein